MPALAPASVLCIDPSRSRRPGARTGRGPESRVLRGPGGASLCGMSEQSSSGTPARPGVEVEHVGADRRADVEDLLQWVW